MTGCESEQSVNHYPHKLTLFEGSGRRKDPVATLLLPKQPPILFQRDKIL